MIWVFCAEGFEGDLVVVRLGDLVSPGFEFGAGPFEAMVAVAELAGLHALEKDIVFDVGSGDDDVGRTGALENDPREGLEPGWVEVLDDFDERGNFVSGKAGVTIDE